jgi:hypothetical protein
LILPTGTLPGGQKTPAAPGGERITHPMNILEIGGTPAEEDCAQIGPDQPAGGPANNKLECEAYIVALRRQYGDEPDGSRLFVKSNSHDYGTYREVAYRYDFTQEAHRAYAERVENGLRFWLDVGMRAPVTYGERGRPVHVIKDPALWILEAGE